MIVFFVFAIRKINNSLTLRFVFRSCSDPDEPIARRARRDARKGISAGDEARAHVTLLTLRQRRRAHVAWVDAAEHDDGPAAAAERRRKPIRTGKTYEYAKSERMSVLCKVDHLEVLGTDDRVRIERAAIGKALGQELGEDPRRILSISLNQEIT